MKTLDMEFIQTEATLKNLIYLFARSIDRVDEELMRELFWPDATDDHGLFTGTAEDYVAWAGGFTERAEDERILIVRKNGNVTFTSINSSFLASNDSKLEPGDQIIGHLVGPAPAIGRRAIARLKHYVPEPLVPASRWSFCWRRPVVWGAIAGRKRTGKSRLHHSAPPCPALRSGAL